MNDAIVAGIIDSMTTFALGSLLVFGIVALVALAAANFAATAERFYAARYNREHWLTEIANRKLAEAQRALVEQVKTPEWEPVEDEDSDNPAPNAEEGGA